MKKIFSLLAITLLAVAGMYGQSPAPGIFNYQGVARNSVGNALVNKTITLRLTIRDGAAAGPLLYQESRTVTTNPFGLFNVQVGSPGASNVTGTVPGVNWGVNTKFIQVEIDPNGGTSFINIGAAQIASVPYALYSSMANDLVLPFNKTQADNGTLFRIVNSGNNTGSRALEGLTNSTQANAYAIVGTVTSVSPGGFSTGVRGINSGTGGNGIGVWGSQDGSGWGVYGTTPTGIGVHGVSTSGTGGRFSTTSGLALNTVGGVRLQNINEAANRILATLPGDGTATWQDPSAVGIITGSGTLNFVPKWTPNGTSLGNSQIFDNGTLVGVGTGATPFAAKLDVLSTLPQIVAHRYTAVQGFDLFYNNTNTYNGYIGTWNIATSNRNFDVGTGDINNVGSFNLVTQAAPRISILPDGTVGVNTTAPVSTSKMHVNSTGATGSILTRTSIFAGGNLDGANGHGLIADGEWRAVWGRNLGSGGRNEATGVRGEAGGSAYTTGTGVLGTATGSGPTNSGVTGIASGSASVNIGARGAATGVTAGQNWGLLGQVNNSSSQNVGVAGQAAINANSWAGAFFGRVAIIDGTQALNRVFTSDAGGNGSWQPLGAIGGVGGSGTLNFVAKWTPDGFTIGNSQIFDNGTRVNIGTNFGDPNSLTINNTGASGGNATVSLQGASGLGNSSGIYLEQTTNRTHLTANQYDADAGDKIMTWDGNNQNVGIGLATPAYRLDVQHGGGTGERIRSTAGFSVLDIDAFSGDGALRFATNGVNRWHIGHGLLNGLTFSEFGGPAGRVIIENGTGRVGVSATSPAARMHVNGDVGASFTLTNGFIGSPAGIFRQAAANTNNFGVVGYAEGATGQNAAVVGDAGGSGVINMGGGLLAQEVSTGINIGVFARAINGAANLAGWFEGTVRINDGTAAAGSVFVSTDGLGTGNWQTAAGAGLVSGSGTLNFIPKWTPNGTSLGNSNVFVDATNFSTSINSTTMPVSNALNVAGGWAQVDGNGGQFPFLFLNSPAASGNGGMIFGASPGGADNGRFLYRTAGDYLSISHRDAGAGTNGLADLSVKNGNVGIGTIAPAARFHVENDATGIGGVRVHQPNETGIPGLKSLGGALITNDVSAAGAVWGNSSVFAQRGDFTAGSIIKLNRQDAIYAVGLGINTAVNTSVQDGVGVASYVSGTGIALFGSTFGGPGMALRTEGAVRLANIGEADGYVLTSDALGNATWQGPASITARQFTANVNVPDLTIVPITQWSVILNEDGGSNYNSVTGEYTIPVSGYYQVNASIEWNSFPANSVSVLMLYLNGFFENENYTSQGGTGWGHNNVMNYARRFNAGDVLQFNVLQTSGSARTLSGSYYGQNFSISLIHR